MIVALVMALVLTAATERPLSDPDIYLHLAAGRWIMTQGQVPTVDVFSHSVAGEVWIPHQWLSQVILHGWQEAFGWSGLMFLGALIIGITLAMTWVFLRRRVSWIYALALMALAFFCLVTHFQVRPHVLAWPLLACWTAHLIGRSETGQMPSYTLLVVMIIWTNLHGSFVLGLVILIFCAVEAVLNCPASWKAWLKYVMVMFLACLINPVGWYLLVFVVKMPSLATLPYLTEWAVPRFTGINPLALMTTFLVALGLLGRLRLHPVRLVLLLLLLYQSMNHARYVSLFGLLTPFLIAKYLQGEEPNSNNDLSSNRFQTWLMTDRLQVWAMGVLLCMASLLVVWQLMTKPYQPGTRITPSRAVNIFLAQQVQGRGLNFINYGAYLIYRGIPVFIDGRLDLYGDKHMHAYIKLVDSSDTSFLQTRLDELGITWSLFPRNATINHFFRSSPAWRPMYEDEESVLFVRR